MSAGNHWGRLEGAHCSVSLYSSPEFISPGCHFFQLYLWPGEVHSDKKSQAMHTLRSLSLPKWPMAGSATGQSMCKNKDVFGFFSPRFPLSVIQLEAWSLIWSGEMIAVHLCPKSATLMMTPWHVHQCGFPPLQILSSHRSSVEEGWNLEPASDFRNKTFSFKLSRTRERRQLLISEHGFNNSFQKDKITVFSPASTHNLLNWLMNVCYYYTQNKHYC